MTGSSFQCAALPRRGAPTGGWALEQRISPAAPRSLCIASKTVIVQTLSSSTYGLPY